MFHVGPLIEAQLKEEKEYGKDWPEKTVSRGFSPCDSSHTLCVL
jgi:hypothetical protein